MNTYVLLFRSLNVGGKNIVPMKTLVDALQKAGCRNVKSYIQSGNVVLQKSTAPGGPLTNALEKEIGFIPEIVTVTKDEFIRATKDNPFNSSDGKTIHFYFSAKKLKPDVERLDKLKSATETYKIADSVFYLHAPDGIGRSKLVAGLASCLGSPVTGRNLNTIHKLNSMLTEID